MAQILWLDVCSTHDRIQSVIEAPAAQAPLLSPAACVRVLAPGPMELKASLALRLLASHASRHWQGNVGPRPQALRECWCVGLLGLIHLNVVEVVSVPGIPAAKAVQSSVVHSGSRRDGALRNGSQRFPRIAR